MHLTIPARFAGPPTMGHGGYVAGLFATRTKGAVQVTLRRPTPLDLSLDLVELEEGRFELRDPDGGVIAESDSSAFTIDPPQPPSIEVARQAAPRSPAFHNERGVHPTCFGCGNRRAEGDGMRIFAGPVDVGNTPQVAAAWRPGEAFAGPDGTVDTQWVAAALDCPGAFAFISDDKRAGLLGRIQFEQYAEVSAGREHLVTGWQIGEDGRKLFAGTALFDEDGTLLAAARATWFGPAVR